MRQRLTYRRNGYVSDFTRFIDGYLQAHPEVRDIQRQGWRIFWERPVNIDERRRTGTDKVPEPPYHYT